MRSARHALLVAASKTRPDLGRLVKIAQESASFAVMNFDGEDAARDDVPSAFYNDISIIEDGKSAIDLASSRIWRGGVPLWASATWHRAKENLAASEVDWQVWINWYDAILAGVEPYSRMPDEHRRVLNEKIAMLPADLWRSGPLVVNPAIATLVADPSLDITSLQLPNTKPLSPPPKVPTQKPAAIEPVILADGRIGLPHLPARTQLPTESLEAGLRAIREGFQELAALAKAAGNIDQRSIVGLESLADRIPLTIPNQQQLFRLGHVEHLLNYYGSTVNQEWPPFLAATYHALNRQFDETIRQFPAWREFKKNAAKDRLDDEQIAVAASVANTLVENLGTQEARQFVDAEIPKALEQLASPLLAGHEPEPFDFVEAGKDELAADVIESVNNLAKKISELALAAASYLAPYPRGLLKAFKGHGEGWESQMEASGKKEGARDADAFLRWAKRFLLAGTGIQLLIAKFPQAASWIEPIIHYLKSCI